jgi:SAM-dependent methyltransferase
VILDVCCGSEKIYQGLQKNLHEEFITVDLRRGDFSYEGRGSWSKSTISVNPIVLADMRFLPFRDGIFHGLVCDPPHLKLAKQSKLIAYYGSWDIYDAIRTVRLANAEFARVLEPNGFLLLKIMQDRKNIYIELLKAFTFFLPIQLKRPRGSFHNPKDEIDGALWLIGQVKKPLATH